MSQGARDAAELDRREDAAGGLAREETGARGIEQAVRGARPPPRPPQSDGRGAGAGAGAGAGDFVTLSVSKFLAAPSVDCFGRVSPSPVRLPPVRP
jgi:hypothetical protein